MTKYFFFFAIAFSILVVTKTQAQKLEVGAGLGILHYKGDLSPNFHPAFARPGINAFFRYNLSRAVSFKAQGLYGSVYADETKVNDPFNQARGLNFSSSILEAGIQAEYNFLTFKHLPRKKNFSPYVFGGISFMHFNPKEAPTASYKKNTIVLPFGVALKGQIKKGWGWGVEFGARKTFTDYIDNWGEGSINGSFQKQKQADYAHDDMYYFTNVSISYTFYKIVCP
jgi:Domain of unknown function (DUF6089)